MNNGWIKAPRAWLDEPIIWKSSDHVAVWLHLNLKATHKKMSAIFGKEKITLMPGQLITGRKAIAEKTGVNESKVRRVLSDLQNDHLIDQQTNSKGRLISLLNWDIEQKSDQQSDHQSDHRPTINKNERINKNSLSVPFANKGKNSKRRRNKYDYNSDQSSDKPKYPNLLEGLL